MAIFRESYNAGWKVEWCLEVMQSYLHEAGLSGIFLAETWKPLRMDRNCTNSFRQPIPLMHYPCSVNPTQSHLNLIYCNFWPLHLIILSKTTERNSVLSFVQLPLKLFLYSFLIINPPLKELIQSKPSCVNFSSWVTYFKHWTIMFVFCYISLLFPHVPFKIRMIQ